MPTSKSLATGFPNRRGAIDAFAHLAVNGPWGKERQPGIPIAKDIVRRRHRGREGRYARLDELGKTRRR